ncbi:GNAT family N-acetyltransferase [Ktedonobacter racemifer]|uniref:GCN5-related N-acetyltransferase n=1 Tax=Ktedonobacter racemifer DSM 44963 TaxID=485913 RepID=D6TRN4_KTERA|nr:GNAT family N-acetyltransferase [Ktedonobacter racemifer]EFH85986.1 GCN5-related N-acetyltransferase [Ktedonobacter racemifer DSM 44963]
MAHHFAIFEPERDLADLVTLWQSTVGSQWPLSAERIQLVLNGPEAHHFALREEGRLIAFAATFQSPRGHDKVGHLAALLVAPDKQRRGIGSELHDVAFNYLQQQPGLRAIQLGSIYPRFWCGAPTNLPVAPFFARKGWHLDEIVYDMVRDLRDFSIPTRIVERMQREGIRFEVATPETIDALRAFEEREFYNWLRAVNYMASVGDYQDLLIAFDGERVVGSLVTSSPRSNPERTDVIWQGLLGEDAGSLGSVGVAVSERGRGIGIALVAYASEILKQRGVRNCYIDWLVLTDFYGKLGYENWRTYQPSWREL